jgi:hypothetical protein
VEGQVRGASITGLRRLRVLEAQNAMLKKMYAELAIENAALKEGVEPKVVTPFAKPQAIAQLVAEHHLTAVRAARRCDLLGQRGTGRRRTIWFGTDRDRRAHEARGPEQPLGFLEAVRSPAQPRLSLEPPIALSAQV